MTTPKTVMTHAGRDKITNAITQGVPLHITQIALGSSDITPDAAMTAVQNQVWAGNIDSLQVDPSDPSLMVARVNVPMTAGPFFIRAGGLLDNEGVLVAIGSLPTMEQIPGLTLVTVSFVFAVGADSVSGITLVSPGNYISTAEKGQPGGVPMLDSTGKVPSSQLPDSTNYELIPATNDSLGGVIIGNGLAIEGDGRVHARGNTAFQWQPIPYPGMQMPDVIDGNRIAVLEGNGQYGVMTEEIPRMDGIRIIQPKLHSLIGMSGLMSANYAYSGADVNALKRMELSFGGAALGWYVRVFSGGLAVAAMAVSPDQTATTAIGVDHSTGDLKVYLDGVEQTAWQDVGEGPFDGKGFFATETHFRIGHNLAFQESGSGDSRLITDGRQMGIEYPRGVNDLGGNWIHALTTINAVQRIDTQLTTKTVGAGGDFQDISAAALWAQTVIGQYLWLKILSDLPPVDNGTVFTFNNFSALVIECRGFTVPAALYQSGGAIVLADKILAVGAAYQSLLLRNLSYVAPFPVPVEIDADIPSGDVQIFNAEFAEGTGIEANTHGSRLSLFDSSVGGFTGRVTTDSELWLENSIVGEASAESLIMQRMSTIRLNYYPKDSASPSAVISMSDGCVIGGISYSLITSPLAEVVTGGGSWNIGGGGSPNPGKFTVFTNRVVNQITQAGIAIVGDMPVP